ncbi:MAG: type II toxin-antitoxin system RelE/ParE family toxin [Flavobacterium sp.]
MEIVWSETALETFFKVVDYLFDHWSNKEIEAFELNVDALIEKIASFNQICPESKLFGYRKCVIDEHNSLVYHITNNTLYLVAFIDNRSQHSY